MIKYPRSLLALCSALVLLLSACTKDDNEPLPFSSVSRLYVSNADTDAAVMSTMIFDPADGKTLEKPYGFDSKLPDGNGIVFDPYSGSVFQVSRQNKNIRTLEVHTDGTLSSRKSFIDESLASAREIAYDRQLKTLYVASSADSAIYVYNRIDTLSGTVRATKKLKLQGQPWGIHLENDRLYVVMDLNRVEVQLFESASALQVGLITTPKKFTITGATRLHGIAYSSERDVLILTDIGQASGAGADSDGALYIITDASAKFTAATAVSPTRTIAGSASGLGNPVDVAWDSRADKNLLYVAEKANRKILVFKFADNGNVAPAVTATLNSSPEAIYLDAR